MMPGAGTRVMVAAPWGSASLDRCIPARNQIPFGAVPSLRRQNVMAEGSNGGTRMMVAMTIVMAVCATISAANLIVTRFGSASADYSSFITQFHDFQGSVNAQLAGLQQSVSLIPAETATITSLQEQVASLKTELSAVEGKLDVVRDGETRTRADLDNLLRASSIPLPTRR